MKKKQSGRKTSTSKPMVFFSSLSLLPPLAPLSSPFLLFILSFLLSLSPFSLLPVPLFPPLSSFFPSLFHLLPLFSFHIYCQLTVYNEKTVDCLKNFPEKRNVFRTKMADIFVHLLEYQKACDIFEQAHKVLLILLFVFCSNNVVTLYYYFLGGT